MSREAFTGLSLRYCGWSIITSESRQMETGGKSCARDEAGSGTLTGSERELTGADRSIMTAPFEDREGWEMNCVALADSVYMEQYDPPEVRAKRCGL